MISCFVCIFTIYGQNTDIPAVTNMPSSHVALQIDLPLMLLSLFTYCHRHIPLNFVYYFNTKAAFESIDCLAMWKALHRRCAYNLNN